MGIPLTLTILLAYTDPAAPVGACLDAFAGWRPAPEVICCVDARYPELATALAAHPAEAYVVTATGDRAALLAAGLAEARGNIVLLLDPSYQLPPDAYQAMFRTLSRATHHAGFFGLATREQTTSRALADPVAVTWTGLTGTPLQAGAIFARRDTLLSTGGIPAPDLLFDYRLVQQLKSKTDVESLPQQVHARLPLHLDTWGTLWQILRYRAGVSLDRIAPTVPVLIPPHPMDLPASSTPSAITPAPISDPLVMSVPILAPLPTIVDAPLLEIAPPQPEAAAAPTVESEAEVEAEAEVAMPISAPLISERDTATPIGLPVVGELPTLAPAQELPGSTPIITASAESFAKLFDDEHHIAHPLPAIPSIWDKLNAVLHRMLFHAPITHERPPVPAPDDATHVDMPADVAPTAAPEAHATDTTENASEPADTSTTDSARERTPTSLGELLSERRLPWQRAPLDSAEVDPLTAAELSQVRRAFSDLHHPAPEPPRPAGRVIEIALAADRREKQEGE